VFKKHEIGAVYKVGIVFKIDAKQVILVSVLKKGILVKMGFVQGPFIEI